MLRYLMETLKDTIYMIWVLSTNGITLTQLFFSFIITPTQLIYIYIYKHITHVGMCIIALVANMLSCLFVSTR